MIKKICILSIIVVIISFFFGDKARDVITAFFNVNFSVNKKPLKNLFTKDELKLYNGIDRPELYLVILGNVFDVTKGAKFYGPNQQYNVFVGRDASRSFVTGQFLKEDISEEVADFNHHELRSINHWLNFYRKEYREIGKLIGKYFDENGNQTSYGEAVGKLIKEAVAAKDIEDLQKQIFPPCNVEWDAERGTRVWCSNRSGGISRDWIGVPRHYFDAKTKTHRCACISEYNKQKGNIKEYEGCDAKSESCFVKE